MKRFLAVLVVLAVIFGIWWYAFRPKHKAADTSKMKPIALKKHSPAFNSRVDSMMTAYLDVKNAFVEDDTVKAKQSARMIICLLELKKDTAGIFETAKSNATDIKSNAESLLTQTDIVQMKHDFSGMTEMMFPSFFKTINYEGPNLYLENCPMAFGDDQPANWISNSSEIVNPYLGKHHPEFKATRILLKRNSHPRNLKECRKYENIFFIVLFCLYMLNI